MAALLRDLALLESPSLVPESQLSVPWPRSYGGEENRAVISFIEEYDTRREQSR